MLQNKSSVEDSSGSGSSSAFLSSTTVINPGNHAHLHPLRAQPTAPPRASTRSSTNATTAATSAATTTTSSNEPPATMVIVGAGIAGLVLALALHQHVGVSAELYEQAPCFAENVGAGMGLYPNGLRVIRDIDRDLFDQIKQAGYPYVYRKWERHDGTEITTAQEDVLSRGDEELCSLGIRRWRLQNILYQAVQARGMKVHFNKTIVGIHSVKPANSSGGKRASVSSATGATACAGAGEGINGAGLLEVQFEDGTRRITHVLFGADGSKSAVRSLVTHGKHPLQYTGIMGLMGINLDRPADMRGISIVSSSTTKCHAIFFPTGEHEQAFRFHFPIPAEQLTEENILGSWGNLSNQMGQKQCQLLAIMLRKEGWHEKFLAPLSNVDTALKVGFSVIEPRLNHWVCKKNRVVLLGDSAHPQVTNIGQSAQLGLEDAGTIALLLQALCRGEDKNGPFEWTHWNRAMQLYETIRLPRTSEILDISQYVGRMRQRRADSAKFAIIREEKLQRQVFFHETAPYMLPGVTYDYKRSVQEALQQEHEVAKKAAAVSSRPSLTAAGLSMGLSGMSIQDSTHNSV